MKPPHFSQRNNSKIWEERKKKYIKKKPHNTKSVPLLLSGLKIPCSSQNHCSPFNLFNLCPPTSTKTSRGFTQNSLFSVIPAAVFVLVPREGRVRFPTGAPAASRHIPGEDEVRDVVLGKATGNRENSRKCSNPAFLGEKALPWPRQTGGARM